VNPANESNRAIINASANGHTDTVQMLLSDTRNEAIALASGNGHPETPHFLLQEAPTSLITVQTFNLICNAVANSYGDVVATLVRHDSIPSAGASTMVQEIASRLISGQNTVVLKFSKLQSVN
jgi:hypothetical protein